MADRYAIYPILGRSDHYEVDFKTKIHATNNRDDAIAEATKHNANHTYGVLIVDYISGVSWSPDNRLELENASHSGQSG